MSTASKNIWRKNQIKDRPIAFAISGIVALYLSIVTYLSIWDTLKFIIALPILFVLFWYILNHFAYFVTSADLSAFTEVRFISKRKAFTIFWTIILFGQLLYWLAYYPGGFNLDAYGQWDQVHGLMSLNNWHPVFTTALYWIITRINDSFAFCIFIQIIGFSFSSAYLLMSLIKLQIPIRFLLFAAIYIGFSPAIGLNNICLIKDVPFCIAMIWLTIILIHIAETSGEWINSNLHTAYFICILLIISLIRHNGIFVILPVIICVSFILRKYIKRIISIATIFLLLFILIQGPIFTLLKVEKHSNAIGEIVGVPMAIMANHMVNDYDNTPEDVKELLLSIADLDDWKEKYILGEWDSCKWEFGGIELFEGEQLSEILKPAWHSICASPENAYRSFRENTRVNWQIFGLAEWKTWVYIEDNDYGIVETPNSFCRSIADAITNFSLNIPGSLLFWNIGTVNVIYALLLWFSAIRCDYKKIVFIVPPIIYNLLTMMLLCGPSHRYFYFNSVFVFPMITLVLHSCTDIHQKS